MFKSFFLCRSFIILVSLLAGGTSTSHAAERDAAAALDAAIATITLQDLREHAGLLADDSLEGRAAGSRGGRAAARYIESKLQKASLKPAGDGGRYTQRFNPGYQNLIGMIPGTDPKLRHEHIIVGAHYDHVGYGSRRNSNGPIGYIHNGADDNASGVAALLEIIDALTHTGWQPRRSIIFAFWDGEEINLLGSRHWVRQPTVPLANVRAAVNVDMVGRMNQGRLEMAGTRTAAGLRRLLASPRLPETMWLDFTWHYEENSDHWPFYEASIPSLLVHTGLHNDYHRPSDDIEKLNVAGMRQTSAYLLEAVCNLADADALSAFRHASRSESDYTQRQRESPLPPMPPRLGLRWNWQEPGGENGDGPRLVVSSVAPGAAADKAGLRHGDHITAVDGMPLAEETLLPAAVLRAASEVSLEVIRGDEEPQAIRVPLTGSPVKLGLAWREDAAAPGVVFITRVVPYSPADRAGIRVHDRIYAVEGEPFADQDALLQQIRALLDDEAESIQFEVESFGRVHAVDVDMRLPTGPAKDASL